MIVKNEEPVLARCLDSVASMMDEIIIVDTGSTDRTKEIAAQYTSRMILPGVMISPPQEIMRFRLQPWITSTVRMRTNTLIWKIKDVFSG